MNYIYRNITGSAATSLIQERSTRTVTVSKCHVTNTHTSSISVDIYIERINEEETRKLYGKLEDNSNRELIRDIYYKVKNLNIPAGTAFELFVDSSCTYDGSFAFKIKLNNTSDTADVFIDYETRDSGIASNSRRNVNQY